MEFQKLDYVNYIWPIGDINKWIIAVSKCAKIVDLNTGEVLKNFEHPKQVNYCIPFWYENEEYDTQLDAATDSMTYRRLLTCWRDGVVRIFTTKKSKSEEEKSLVIELEAHKISCTSACISNDEKYLATGGRDYKTFLWDLESVLNKFEEGQTDTKFKPLHQLEITRNMITWMKWLPNCNDKFIQTSEDLNMRIFSVVDDMIQQTVSVKVGATFATTIDIDPQGESIITGHRWFNNTGSFIKIWDLTNLLESSAPEPVLEQSHNFSCVSAHFIFRDGAKQTEKYIITWSADKMIKVINLQGIQVSYISSNDIYTAMWPIGLYDSMDALNQQKWIVVAANNKPEVMVYNINCLTMNF